MKYLYVKHYSCMFIFFCYKFSIYMHVWKLYKLLRLGLGKSFKPTLNIVFQIILTL